MQQISVASIAKNYYYKSLCNIGEGVAPPSEKNFYDPP